MKFLFSILFSIPALSFSQYDAEEPEIVDSSVKKQNWAIHFKAYFNPMFFNVINNSETDRNILTNFQSGFDARVQYTLKNVFAFRLGLGTNSNRLNISNTSLIDLINGNEHDFNVERFTQNCTYLTVPMEIGVAPKIGKGGWFVPSFFLSVSPHFRIFAAQEVVFNQNIFVPLTTQAQLENDFAGGMREVYTSFDVHFDFMFYVGSKKKIGLGPSFSYNNNLSGPQTYLLRAGKGFSGGLILSIRI